MYNKSKNMKAHITQLCIEQYEKSIAENKRSINEASRLKNEMQYQNEYSEIRSIMESHANTRFKKAKFSEQVFEGLVHECINYIFTGAAKKSLSSQRAKAIKEATINNFIKEEGAHNLVDHFYESSYLLSECAKLIDEYHNKYLKEAEENDDYDNVTPDLSFYDKLKSLDVDHVADVIRVRVNSEIDNFIQNNKEDRIKIKDSLKKTQDKINKLDPNEDEDGQIEESFQILGKRELNRIRHSRPKSVFECMFQNIYESALKKEEVKKLYKDDSDQIDMDAIMEDCTLLYTFLETVNTAKLKNVDEKYISETLDAMK